MRAHRDASVEASQPFRLRNKNNLLFYNYLSVSYVIEIFLLLFLLFFMFCAQIPFSCESIFPFFPLAVPIFAPHFAARTIIFLKRAFPSSYSSCFVFRFLSQLCVHLFIFLFDCPFFSLCICLPMP